MNISYMMLKGMPLGGGVEKYTEEIGSRLAKKGHKITVYTMKHYGAEDGFYKGMAIKNIPALKLRSLEKLSSSFLTTIYDCITRNSDIIHYHAFGSGVFQIIPYYLGRNVLVQGHGLGWKRAKWGFIGKNYLRASEFPGIRFAHAITVVSKVQQQYIKRNFKKDCVHIPTGVNPPKLEAPDLIKRFGLNDYILFASRLTREKGAHYLIEAFKKLNTRMKLVIAGDAKYEQSYKKEIFKLAGNDKRIIFTGFVQGKLLNELFSNCSLFVLPSEIEGLATVLLESMSYGNCCLVSDIPENIECLNGFGYTFKNKNAIDLKNKMQILINNKHNFEEIRTLASEHVRKNYSWDEIARKFENFYKTVITGKYL